MNKEEQIEKIEDVKELSNYELVRVPTGEALAIQTPTGEIINSEQAIVEILNIVKSIEKSVAW